MQSDGQTGGVGDRAEVPTRAHLDCHCWPLVRWVHSARTAPRPGWGHEQLVLIAACSDLQVVQLGQEATQRALFDAHRGPWSDRWLPAWLTPLLPDTHRGILLRAAQELDAQVTTPDPIPEVESTAQAVVRYTLFLFRPSLGAGAWSRTPGGQIVGLTGRGAHRREPTLER